MAERGILFVLFLTLALVAYLMLFHRFFCLASPHDDTRSRGTGLEARSREQQVFREMNQKI